MQKEEWRDIAGYEGLYQVSNLGNVKSLNYNRTGKERILKPGNDGRGYLFVQLCKEGIRKKCLVHRLVAETFIPNPNKYPVINHRDEIRDHNWVKNLEWCTQQYNINYGNCKEKLSEALINNPKKSYLIKCLDLETNEEKIYPSINEAARQFQVQSMIIWRYIYRYSKPYKNRYIFSEINK